MPDNRQQYDAYAERYHAKRMSEAESIWNRYLDFPMIEQLLGTLEPGTKLLDLGCGSGVYTRWLRERGCEVCGADFSEGMIEIARRECPEIAFTVAEVTATPYPNDAFDGVISALVLHYLQDLSPAFAEVARVLRPGGSYVFTIHHPIIEMLDMLSGEGEPRATARPYFHNQPYTWRMLGDMELTSYHHTFEALFAGLTQAGFVVEALLESRLPESLRERYPEEYAKTNAYPYFLGIRARLKD